MDKIVNPLSGEEVTFLVTSKQSNGERTYAEVLFGTAPGFPLHIHKRFSETFTVVEGTLNVQVGKQKMILKPGESVTAPKNTPHRFYNTSGKPVRFLVEMQPASEGFENVLRIGFGLAQDGQARLSGMPKSLRVLAIMTTMGESNIVGIFSIVERIMKFIGNRPKSLQLKQELIERYMPK
jgi:mannose-6-phosphate isomerase-like protein (cupin superfamily)